MSGRTLVLIGLATVIVSFQNCSKEEMAGFKFVSPDSQDLLSLEKRRIFGSGTFGGGPFTGATPTPTPALPTPTPPVLPTPAPGAAAFKCVTKLHVNGQSVPTGSCFSNIAKIDVRQLELYAAANPFKAYPNAATQVICKLKAENGNYDNHMPKEPGYPIEWDCTPGGNRVNNPNATGFTSMHLNSPFRKTALSDVVDYPLYFGGDAEPPPIPQNPKKGDLVFYFNNEIMLPVTAVQDAIAEAKVDSVLKTEHPIVKSKYDFSFTTTCAASTVVRLGYTVQVLRCSYTNPVLLINPYNPY